VVAPFIEEPGRDVEYSLFGWLAIVYGLGIGNFWLSQDWTFQLTGVSLESEIYRV
jgi:hypothetical protein